MSESITFAIKNMDYEGLNGEIKRTMRRSARDVVQLGFMLRLMMEDKIWEAAYGCFDEYLDKELHMDYSMASRLIGINKKYSINGHSMEIAEKYEGFSQGLLIEMLNMAPELEAKVTPDMTVKQVREIKKQERQKKEEAPAPEKEEAIIDGEYREVKEPGPADEKIATSQPDDAGNSHDESWFVGQYAKIKVKEAAEIYNVCLSENNNSDRAKAVQKYIAPYGCHSTSCAEWDFSFHSFSSGLDFRIGQEQMHLKYGRLVMELMKIFEVHKEKEAVQPVILEAAPEFLPAEKEPPLEDGLAVTKHILEQEKKLLADYLEVGGLPEMTVLRQKTIVGALAAMVCDLEEQETEVQPELPVMKNDNQRKDFINSYREWPVWIDTKDTGERYYRYNFENGTSFVVKTYFHKCFDYKSSAKDWKDRYHDGWGAEEYYVLMDGKHFKDCLVNKSAMVDSLKRLQNGRGK